MVPLPSTFMIATCESHPTCVPKAIFVPAAEGDPGAVGRSGGVDALGHVDGAGEVRGGHADVAPELRIVARICVVLAPGEDEPFHAVLGHGGPAAHGDDDTED